MFKYCKKMLTTVNKVSESPKHVPKNSIKIHRPKRASSHPMHKVNDGTGSQGSSSWCVRIVPNLFRIILNPVRSQILWELSKIFVLTVSVSTPQPPQGNRLEQNL